MSDIVEKTLTALPGLFLQNQSVGGPTAAKASFSSRLGGLVRGITALTSKHVGVRRAGRSGAPEGGPRSGRLWSRGGPLELALRRICLSVLASLRKRHLGCPDRQLGGQVSTVGRDVDSLLSGAKSLQFEPPCVSRTLKCQSTDTYFIDCFEG